MPYLHASFKFGSLFITFFVKFPDKISSNLIKLIKPLLPASKNAAENPK